MSMDHLRKVGRGGAGNFYTPSEVRDVLRKSDDLESAHPPPSTDSHPSTSQIPEDTPTLTGRGGAGNYVAPSEDAAAAHSSSDGIGAGDGNGVAHTGHTSILTKAKEKVVEKLGGGSNYSGRGGAGNYRGDEAHAEGAEKERGEEERRREVEEGVRAEVEGGGLKRPEGVYLGSGRAGGGDLV